MHYGSILLLATRLRSRSTFTGKRSLRYNHFCLTVHSERKQSYSMQIHIARNGQATGPFPLEEINRQLAAGTLSLTDQAWYEGASGWMPLSAVPGVTGGVASTPRPPETAMPTQPVTTVVPVSSGPTEPLAIWSLVLSLLGLFCCGLLCGIPGVICGHLALSKIEKQPELQGRALAVAGLIIGYFAVICWLLYLIFFGGVRMLQGILHNSSG